MKRKLLTIGATIATTTLLLAGCGNGDTNGSADANGDTGGSADGEAAGDEGEELTLTLAGWSLDTTPEFQTLADGFTEQNPNIKVELVEYADGEDYDTQMITDLAGGTAPDLYPLKNLNKFFMYYDGEQLLDVSDITGDLPADISGLENYQVDGTTYAVPYRQDAWFLYYNKDLFDAAGVDHPDGSWTWDDYGQAAKQITDGLADTDTPATGAYQHSWQSTIQGFATAQTPNADFLSGDWEYFVPYYDRAVALQDEGAIVDYGTLTTNSLSYQSQFGKQDAAMLVMGSWYIATLLAEQESGDADQFEWGMAPVPQYDASTTDTPITFADPTAIGINPAVSDEVAAAAKQFLAYIASEDAAADLVEIGITPAVTNETVAEVLFGLDGVPTDELSQFTYTTRDVRPENIVDANTAALQNILGDAHSAIMSGSVSPDAGIAEAMERAEAEVLSK